MEITYITKDMLSVELFTGYLRYQEVTKCWRKVNGEWEVKDIAFVESWGEENFKTLVECLKGTIDGGGSVIGVFEGDRIVGFASLEGKAIGPLGEYLELSSIHVTEDCRGEGIGTAMFTEICEIARKMNAKKLYISSHSSVESQAFYSAMGCRETSWYDAELVEKEPCDCHLEYPLFEKNIGDIYENCPDLMCKTINLSHTKKSDASELLKCYSDVISVPLFNSDNCDGDDFHYTDIERMTKAIDFWDFSYKNKFFVRMTVRDNQSGEAVGTVEMFRRVADDAYNGYGVLRIDLRSDYETEAVVDDILYLSNCYFYDAFGVDKIITKAIPQAVNRIASLKKYGFEPAKQKLMDIYGDYFCRERKR